MSYISVEHLTKRNRNDTILKDVTLSLEKRKIIGPKAKRLQNAYERSVASLSLPRDMFIENKKLLG